MRSLAARLIIGTLIVMIGVALALALGDMGARALEQETAASPLPQDAVATVAQNDGLFFTARAGNDLYVSADGQTWQTFSNGIDGTVRLVATPERGGNTLFAATEDALWLTTDAGATWQTVDVPLDGAPLALVARPDATEAYLATEAGQLYHVVGTHATALDWSRDWATLNDFAISPAGDAFLAATDTGLFRSATGETWERVPTLPAVPDLTRLADSDLLLAATRDSGLFRSADGGVTWEPASAGLQGGPGSSLAITALAQDPGQANALFVATAYVLGHTTRQASPGGIYMSPDGGSQWIEVVTFAPGDPIVTALLPAEGMGLGIRALTREGITSYQLDADRALSNLQSTDPTARLNGAKVLSVAAVPTQADALLPLIADEDGQVAFYVARALGRIGGERVTTEMVEILDSDQPTIVKLRALMALETIADAGTIPALAAAFEEPALARGAADALAAIATDEAWQPLTAAMADAELTPQRQAAMAALEENSEAAVAPLIPLLSAGDATVRANAAQTLAWLSEPEAIRPLRALLEDADPTVRANAAFALGELGDRESVSRLGRLSASDQSAEVRVAASRAIERAEREPTTLDAGALEPVAATSWRDRLGDQALGWIQVAILAVTALLALAVLFIRPRQMADEQAIR